MNTIEPGETYLPDHYPPNMDEDKASDLSLYLAKTRSAWLVAGEHNLELLKALETVFNLIASDYYQEAGEWPCLYCGGTYNHDEGKRCYCAASTSQTTEPFSHSTALN